MELFWNNHWCKETRMIFVMLTLYPATSLNLFVLIFFCKVFNVFYMNDHIIYK